MEKIKEVVNKIKLDAKANFVPILREESGKILFNLCLKKKPKNILEIGTATGYSALLMKEAVPDAVICTIEKDKDRFKKACLNFEDAQVSDVHPILGDAMEELQKFEKEEKTFDLIFLDGPKGQYVKYLPYLKNLLSAGGVLFADDVYFHGLVKGDEFVSRKKRTMVRNLRQFNEKIANDKDFKTEILDIEDGICISEKI